MVVKPKRMDWKTLSRPERYFQRRRHQLCRLRKKETRHSGTAYFAYVSGAIETCSEAA